MPPIAKQWGNLIDIEIPIPPLIATTINHQPSTIKRTVIVI
ncbi:hypothetical protein O7C57_08480 [Providencia sp. 21OH12SH02B-Prov]|nr:hypothetical protein [Providencia sp. 21OH12SH02B-Prov]WBA58583.1 hypothetical protein O7C57_08480 [Providencia sp. 21OH12SH02B-Prov]